MIFKHVNNKIQSSLQHRKSLSPARVTSAASFCSRSIPSNNGASFSSHVDWASKGLAQKIGGL